MFRLAWAIALLERLLLYCGKQLDDLKIDDDVKLALSILKKAKAKL